jgi:hypothetical protein
VSERDQPLPDDRPAEPKPEDPFMPIVESLLNPETPVDSPEFQDALQVAGPAERAEVRRRIRQEIGWREERLDAIERRLDELRAEHPELDDEN